MFSYRERFENSQNTKKKKRDIIIVLMRMVYYCYANPTKSRAHERNERFENGLQKPVETHVVRLDLS